MSLLSDISLDCKSLLREQKSFDRYLLIFWLMGPFILLIERTPGDFWISFIGLCFIARCIKNNHWCWLSHWWVRFAIIFWLVALISACISDYKLSSLGETTVWIRFPLFAAAVAFWLGQDRRALLAMLVSIGLASLVMCGILALEITLVGAKAGRLSWPYGDNVPGGYLAKVCLPPFLVAVAYVASKIRATLV